MKYSIVLRVGLAIAGIVLAGSAFAQDQEPVGPGPGPDGPGRAIIARRPPFERAFGGGIQGRWWDNPKIAEQLKLTDDQRKAFDEILQQHRATLIDLHANLEKAELALEPLISGDQPNENAILAQIDRVAQARAELEKANARYLLALRGKLSPDQWKQVQEFRKNREQMREQMHERWGQNAHRPGGNAPGGGAPEVAPPTPPPPGGMF
jgi:periplasmic protein CpxP/Spy